MAKSSKKDRRKDENNGDGIYKYLREDTLHAILAVIFFVLGLFLVLSSGPVDKGGKAGTITYSIFHNLFGLGYYLLPLVFFILCVSFFRSLHKKLALTHTVGGLLFFLSGLGLINISLSDQGGFIGGFISKPLIKTFDVYASVAILLAFIVISLIIIFDTPLKFTFITSLFKKNENASSEENEPEIIISNP